MTTWDLSVKPRTSVVTYFTKKITVLILSVMTAAGRGEIPSLLRSSDKAKKIKKNP